MTNNKTEWEPMPGWLMLIPVKLPNKTEGGVLLPEQYVTKSNSGVCIKAGHDLDNYLVGEEIFFPVHNEHRVIDSDTNQLYYVVPRDSVIMHRKAVKQPEVLVVGEQGTSAARMFMRSK